MKQLIFTLSFSFLFCMVYGQIDFTPYPGISTWCPGEENTFTSTVTGSGCGTRTWTITNGKFIVNSQPVSTAIGNEVKVKWDDIAAVGKLKVTVTCAEVVHSQEKSYAIRSLAGRQPVNAKANQTLLFCGILTINLSLNPMILENTGGATGITQQFADGYEWVLPTGWSANGTTGTVTTAAEIIDIAPDNGCRGGTVTVKAFVNCGTGKKYSSAASIKVDRPVPTITITAQAGYPGPSCGAVAPVTFTVNHTLSCVQPINGFTWVFPSGWAPSPIFTNSNSISIIPSGGANDAGPINVTVNLNCGSLPATPRQLVFTPPTFSISEPICNSGTNVTVANIAPDVNVTWAVTSNMSIFSGQGTSSAVLKATSTGALGSGTISATVGCPNTTITPKTVWVGTPSQPGSISGNTSPSVGGIYQYVCSAAAQGAAFHNWIMPFNGNPLWSVSGGNINGIVNTLVPNFIVGSSAGNLQIFGQNNCGTSGVSRLRVNPVSGGGGGIQQRIQAFPNPAQKDLTIEDASGTLAADGTLEEFAVVLFNSQNKEVKSGTSKNGRIILDVQDMRNGFYFLRIQKGEELITEQIQIKK